MHFAASVLEHVKYLEMFDTYGFILSLNESTRGKNFVYGWFKAFTLFTWESTASTESSSNFVLDYISLSFLAFSFFP